MINTTEHAGYVVEAGYEFPRTAKRCSKYPFDSMNVGDSFRCSAKDAKLAVDAAYHYGRAHKRKYTVRKIDDGQYRCWRIK